MHILFMFILQLLNSRSDYLHVGVMARLEECCACVVKSEFLRRFFKIITA